MQTLNQFKQSPEQGLLDMQVDMNTISCQVDASESGSLLPGQAVTVVDSASGVPKVIAAADDADDIFGFINYTQKDKSYEAGDRLEVSFFRGNVMYMTSSAAIARNAEVMVVIASKKVATATTGARVVGRALDKATAADQLIRVLIDLPGGLAA